MTKSREAFRTISEVAEWLDVPPHVLRFWESRFTQVKPVKRAGGRRYYRPTDMELLGGIKKLLHDDGLTIKGVQKLLREEGVAHVAGFSIPLEVGPPPVVETVEPEAEVALDVTPPAPASDNVVSLRPAETAEEAAEAEPQLDLVPLAAEEEEAASDPEPALEPEPEPEPEPELEPEIAQAPVEDAEVLAPPETPPAPAPEPAPLRPAQISVPDDPSDTEIAATPQLIGALAQTIGGDFALAPEAIAPLIDRLESLQNRMEQTRGG